jgi:hypothetical protein
VERADDLERHGGRNYVRDAVPSEPDLHHAMGRDPHGRPIAEE